jgi:hypothetical protein
MYFNHHIHTPWMDKEREVDSGPKHPLTSAT